jgi:phosphoglycerate dehydrogenase-like enzyme
MYHERKKTNLPKIVFATTPDKPFFKELWNDYSRKCARHLGYKVTLINETATVANRHWPELLSDADGIITTWYSPRIDEEILNANSKLKIIGHAAGSVADYISPELFKRNIKVTSANLDMAHSVAEWCLMGALMGIRHVMNYSKFGILGGELDWTGRHRCNTIQNATVGIWGFGAIAGELRKMLKPLSPGRVLVNSNHLSEFDAMRYDMEKTSLAKLFEKSDIIFLLAGLSKHTEGKIDAKLLTSIKDGALLVNAGRGPLVQENALINELSKERFTGVFDVFHEEPLSVDNPLQNMSNVIMTPHNAGYPSRMNYVSTILEEFDRFFNKTPLKHQIQVEKLKFMTLNHVN